MSKYQRTESDVVAAIMNRLGAVCLKLDDVDGAKFCEYLSGHSDQSVFEELQQQFGKRIVHAAVAGRRLKYFGQVRARTPAPAATPALDLEVSALTAERDEIMRERNKTLERCAALEAENADLRKLSVAGIQFRYAVGRAFALSERDLVQVIEKTPGALVDSLERALL